MQALNILKQAVEKSNNHESFNLIIFVVCILQGLASNVPNSFNSRGLLILRVADVLIDECIWIFVHDVDQHNEGLFDKLVKNTFVIKNRLSDEGEEVPHPLTNAILVDQKNCEAGKTFFSRDCFNIIECLKNCFLKYFFQGLIEIWVFLTICYLEYPPNGRHKSITGKTRF